MQIVLNLTATPAMLEALHCALDERLELLRSGESADEAAHGAEWATAEIKRVQILHDAVAAHPQFGEAMAARVAEFENRRAAAA